MLQSDVSRFCRLVSSKSPQPSPHVYLGMSPQLAEGLLLRAPKTIGRTGSETQADSVSRSRRSNYSCYPNGAHAAKERNKLRAQNNPEKLVLF
ncbi:hypothetical protein [Achromobacter spanius]|uniref:hypothetical protein n=1 Tax=Achromobacter spanius TaxID=217203 RepID=UPI00380F8C6D